MSGTHSDKSVRAAVVRSPSIGTTFQVIAQFGNATRHTTITRVGSEQSR